jgi:hypothetical protein
MCVINDNVDDMVVGFYFCMVAMIATLLFFEYVF